MSKTSIVPAASNTALGNAVGRYVNASKSKNTQRTYASGWRDFEAFCASYNLSPLPASSATVVRYITLLAEGNKPSAIQVKLAAISFSHRLKNLDDPTKAESVRTVMAGIRREHGTAPDRKAPVTRVELFRMVSAIGLGIADTRDRAILLVGFGGCFRRSELAGLTRRDVDFTATGMVITLRQSKTDQEGRGIKKNIPLLENDELCPVRALRAWLTVAQIESGPIFRRVDRHSHVGNKRLGDHAIAVIVKQAAKRVGLDPARFSGHSLRAGFITQSALDGTPEWEIQEVSTHRNTAVLRDYIRDAGVGQQHAIRRAFGEKDNDSND